MPEKDNSMLAIAKRIRERRESLNYSYQDLANLTGMSKSTLQRYESGGIKNIPLSRLDALAEALNTTPSYLMGWEDDPLNYDDGLLLSEIPLSYVKACNGDVKKAYAMMNSVDDDALSFHHKSRLRSVARLEENSISPEQDEQIADFIDYLLSKRDKE